MAMPVALLIKEGLYVELGLNCNEQEQNHSFGGRRELRDKLAFDRIYLPYFSDCKFHAASGALGCILVCSST